MPATLVLNLPDGPVPPVDVKPPGLQNGTSWMVDLLSREVRVRGLVLTPPLSRKEFDILSLLWQRRRTACSRADIAGRGWPERSPGDVGNDEIDQYIRRIRRRIGDAGGDAGNITTMRRFGYKLD